MAVRRGDLAKELITDTLVDTFPGAFVLDKKIYISVEDGTNGKVQIAVSLTMPKTPVTVGFDPVAPSTSATPTTHTPVELDAADQAKVEELKKKLGIS